MARTADGSPSYPVYLQQALDAQTPGVSSCVPLCTACHLTTQGGPQMLNSFCVRMERIGGLGIEQPESAVASALARVAAARTDSDGDGTSDIDELNAGDSPSIAGDPGKGAFCSNLRYGCGSQIASAPPVEGFSMLGWDLAVLGLAIVRWRRARPSRTQAATPSTQRCEQREGETD